MKSDSYLENLMSLFSAAGAYSPLFALLVAGLALVAAWKVPDSANSRYFPRIAESLGVHFALAGVAAWLGTWKSASKEVFGFLAMLQVWSLGLAVLWLVYALSSTRQKP